MITLALLLAGCIHLDCRPTGRLIVEPVRLAGSPRVDGVMGGVDCAVTTDILICKCCSKPARWCGEGENGCGIKECDHIHCDHCGMHYILESEKALGSKSMDEARALMLAAYNRSE